jgi:3-phosphoshikimate 1-carboxyvinyltransferase
VPRDPSSAAFAMVAALITPHSHITLPGISMNPQRVGLIATLQEMGGSLVLSKHRIEGGEDVADIEVRSSLLHGIDVPEQRAASMIDEYPILSIAAACASGKTHMVGVSELRVKETDRIAVMADGLRRCGVKIDETDDTMTVLGTNSDGNNLSAHNAISGGVTIASQHDHRIAMSFLSLGMVSKSPIIVEDVSTIATSFPGFAALMNNAGAKIDRQS